MPGNCNWEPGFRIRGLIYREGSHREHKKHKHPPLKSLLRIKAYLRYVAAQIKALRSCTKASSKYYEKLVCLFTVWYTQVCIM